MLIKREEECEEFVAGDKSLLRELLHPKNDNIHLNYSIAIAKVQKGKSTLWHRLRASEVYYILHGSGRISVNDESEIVNPGDVIYIPSGSKQKIENISNGDLIFLCIVEPPWKKEDEEILEEW